jgi:phosphocarrier protein HPr
VKSVKVKIQNKLGLHARPAMTFAEKASGFSSEITVRRVDSQETVDGKSIMQILMLAGTKGTELEIRADGPDASDALAALKTLVDVHFEEEDE